MGLGRRIFLKLSGLALAGIAIDPLQAVITHGNLYLNRHLGLMFQKPSEWGFIRVKNFERLKNNQILGNGFEEIKDEVWEELGSPIIVITKYFEDKPEHKGDFSLTITLNITPKEGIEEYGIESFDELIELSLIGTSRLLKEFELVKHYPPYIISGCLFYESDATYTFEHIEMNAPVKVELKALRAEHNGLYYDFSMHQSTEQNQKASLEFKQFMDSIRLI